MSISKIERPPHRKRRLTVALDDQLYKRSKRKARNEKRLRAVARLLLDQWSSDDWPSSMEFSEAAIEEQLRRAPKVPRQKTSLHVKP